MQVFTGIGLFVLWAAKTVRSAVIDLGVVVEVPFDFVVGTHTFQPGTYRFEALRSPTPGVCVLAVRGEDGRVHKLAVSNLLEAGKGGMRSKLVLHRRGRRHFLSEVWLEGRRLGLQLYRSLYDSDEEIEEPETELVLLSKPDSRGRNVYVVQDLSCGA
jgi:hypothetical protein